MLTFLLTRILTWQTAVGILLAALSLLPIHRAYKELRFDRSKESGGAVREAFISASVACLSWGFLPPMMVMVPVQWILYAHKHLLSLRAVLASLTVVATFTIYYVIATQVFGLENILYTWYQL